MIQVFFLIEPFSILLSRILIALIYFKLGYEYFLNKKKNYFAYFLSGIMLFLGVLTSFITLAWIFILLIKMIQEKKIDLFNLSLIAYFLVLLSVGPGKISLDEIFFIRFLLY